MSTNRRRHANVVPVASISMWSLVCLFAGAAGLGYVSLKNQLHAGADEISRLERDLGQVKMRIEVVTSEINKLQSQYDLKKRFDNDKGHLGGLMDIPPDRIVWVDRPNQTQAETPDVQQTSNLTR